MKTIRTSALLVFIVTTSLAQVPVISSIVPVGGRADSSVYVNGTGFSAIPSENQVFIGPMEAPVLTSTPTSVAFRVPRGIWSAPVTVRTPQGQAISRDWFSPLVGCSRTLDSSAYTISRSLGAVGYNPAIVIFSDIDGDGVADLLVANRSTNSVTVFRTVPFGPSISTYYFSTDADILTEFYPTDLKSADMNNDGKWDIITTNHFSPTIRVWPNHSSPGNTVIAPAREVQTQDGSKHLAIADFDNDGKLDIAVACRDTGLVEVLRNTTTRSDSISFSPPVASLRLTGVTSIAAADLDGDGRTDIILASEGEGRIVIMQNISGPGGISFSAAQSVILLPSPADIQVADMNADGRPDIVAVSAASSLIALYSNTSTPGSVSFTTSCTLPTPSNPSRVAIADLNADGSPDAAVVTLGGIAALYRNKGGTGCILQQEYVWSFGGSSYGVAIGDLTGDNKADLALSDFAQGLIHLYQNTLPEVTEVSLRAGWNMVSVPRHPASSLASDLFPTASSLIFGFTGAAYVGRDTLAVGPGYWVYYLAATLNSIGGTEVTSAFVDLPVANRWYLIGSLTTRIPRSALFSEPAGAFSGSEVFGLVNGAYRNPDYLEPGLGYWIYINQPCRVRLQSQ
jgi:hypothetical protein